MKTFSSILSLLLCVALSTVTYASNPQADKIVRTIDADGNPIEYNVVRIGNELSFSYGEHGWLPVSFILEKELPALPKGTASKKWDYVPFFDKEAKVWMLYLQEYDSRQATGVFYYLFSEMEIAMIFPLAEKE